MSIMPEYIFNNGRYHIGKNIRYNDYKEVFELDYDLLIQFFLKNQSTLQQFNNIIYLYLRTYLLQTNDFC